MYPRSRNGRRPQPWGRQGQGQGMRRPVVPPRVQRRMTPEERTQVAKDAFYGAHPALSDYLMQQHQADIDPTMPVTEDDYIRWITDLADETVLALMAQTLEVAPATEVVTVPVVETPAPAPVVPAGAMPAATPVVPAGMLSARARGRARGRRGVMPSDEVQNEYGSWTYSAPRGGSRGPAEMLRAARSHAPRRSQGRGRRQFDFSPPNSAIIDAYPDMLASMQSVYMATVPKLTQGELAQQFMMQGMDRGMTPGDVEELARNAMYLVDFGLGRAAPRRPRPRPGRRSTLDYMAADAYLGGLTDVMRMILARDPSIVTPEQLADAVLSEPGFGSGMSGFGFEDLLPIAATVLSQRTPRRRWGQGQQGTRPRSRSGYIYPDATHEQWHQMIVQYVADNYMGLDVAAADIYYDVFNQFNLSYTSLTEPEVMAWIHEGLGHDGMAGVPVGAYTARPRSRSRAPRRGRRQNPTMDAVAEIQAWMVEQWQIYPEATPFAMISMAAQHFGWDEPYGYLLGGDGTAFWDFALEAKERAGVRSPRRGRSRARGQRGFSDYATTQLFSVDRNDYIYTEEIERFVMEHQDMVANLGVDGVVEYLMDEYGFGPEEQARLYDIVSANSGFRSARTRLRRGRREPEQTVENPAAEQGGVVSEETEAEAADPTLIVGEMAHDTAEALAQQILAKNEQIAAQQQVVETLQSDLANLQSQQTTVEGATVDNSDAIAATQNELNAERAVLLSLQAELQALQTQMEALNVAAEATGQPTVSVPVATAVEVEEETTTSVVTGANSAALVALHMLRRGVAPIVRAARMSGARAVTQEDINPLVETLKQLATLVEGLQGKVDPPPAEQAPAEAQAPVEGQNVWAGAQKRTPSGAGTDGTVQSPNPSNRAWLVDQCVRAAVRAQGLTGAQADDYRQRIASWDDPALEMELAERQQEARKVLRPGRRMETQLRTPTHRSLTSSDNDTDDAENGLAGNRAGEAASDNLFVSLGEARKAQDS